MPEQINIHANDEREISIYKWQKTNQNKPKAIIQIAHGMAEHILRYDDFATFLTDNNYIVYGNNHRGHGKSAKVQGYFSQTNGFEKVVHDMKLVTDHIKMTHPNTPLYLFGHSMGSFLTRRYIQLYDNQLAGVILSGTGGNQGIAGKVGLLIAKWERKRKGSTTPSPLMDKLVFGAYNKHFKPARTDFDFLSRDEAEVDKYIADPSCGFICTTGFFVDLISGIETIHKSSEIKRTNSDLPIYLIAGTKDPVGNYGKGVQQVYNKYNNSGFNNLTIKLYEDARHELLNETNKQEVYTDILTWLQNNLSGGN